jgi:hypothetical protein
VGVVVASDHLQEGVVVRRKRNSLMAAVAGALFVVANAAPAWADDVHVNPTTQGMPAGQTIQRILGWLAQSALFASLGSILVGAAVWGLSKLFGNYGGAHKGLVLTLGGCAGALIVGIAPQLVNMFFKAS